MDQRKGPFFIQVETHLFPVGNNFLRVFDRLFKLHYMLDIHYAAPLLNFYNFFESSLQWTQHPQELLRLKFYFKYNRNSARISRDHV